MPMCIGNRFFSGWFLTIYNFGWWKEYSLIFSFWYQIQIPMKTPPLIQPEALLWVMLLKQGQEKNSCSCSYHVKGLIGVRGMDYCMWSKENSRSKTIMKFEKLLFLSWRYILHPVSEQHLLQKIASLNVFLRINNSEYTFALSLACCWKQQTIQYSLDKLNCLRCKFLPWFFHS